MVPPEDARTRKSRDHFSRRQLLGTAAGATGTLFALGSTELMAQEATPRAVRPEQAYAAREVVYLDGAFAGFIERSSGGVPFVEVADLSTSAETRSKGIAALRYEPLSIRFGSGMSAAWYDWVASALGTGKSPLRKSGAVVVVDYYGKAVSHVLFTNALISELTLPAFDAASKDASIFSVTIVPESSKQELLKGAQLTLPPPVGVKRWLNSNFRLSIDILALDHRDVRKIDPMATNIRIASSAGRSQTRFPTVVEPGNLVVTLSQPAAEPFFAWFDDFAVKGQSTKKSDGTLAFMDATFKQELASVIFHGLGITKVALRSAESSDAVREATAEMFCESIELKLSKVA